MTRRPDDDSHAPTDAKVEAPAEKIYECSQCYFEAKHARTLQRYVLLVLVLIFMLCCVIIKFYQPSGLCLKIALSCACTLTTSKFIIQVVHLGIHVSLQNNVNSGVSPVAVYW